MTVLIIFGVLLGVATASRLRAITVVPVMALMMATIVLFGTALGEMVWWLSVRAVGEYLARWGFTPQKAARRAYECDDEAVKLWLQREYPKIVARAKREKADICRGDETGVRSDESRHWGLFALRPDGDHQDPGTPQEPVADRGGDQSGQGAVHDLCWRHHAAAADSVFMLRLTKDTSAWCF